MKMILISTHDEKFNPFHTDTVLDLFNMTILISLRYLRLTSHADNTSVSFRLSHTL